MATNKQQWLGPLTESFRILWRWLSAAVEALRPVVVRSFGEIRVAFSKAAGRLRRTRPETAEPQSERGPPNAEGGVLAPHAANAEAGAAAGAPRPDWLRSALRVNAWPPGLVRVLDRAAAIPVTWRTFVLVSLAGAGTTVGLYSNCGIDGCPDVATLSAYQPGGAPVLLDKNGNRFADLTPFERVVVKLDSLPEHVGEAFIAVEDRRFWKHDGVDWQRVVGAAIANIKSGGVSQGSSTISMQLARNVFPEDLPGKERTFRRKLQEMRVAKLIERRYEKPVILEMYLNHIYFGGGAYGIEAASHVYFDKPAAELTVAEAAMLAALPKAPSHYDPRRQPERGLQRRNLVLALMEDQGYLTAEEAAKARESKMDVREDGERDRSAVPLGAWFIDVIRPQLEDHFGEALYRSRLHIYTTLDPVAQKAAEEELEKQLASLDSRVRNGDGDLQGAAVFMDATTGEVRALVGGRDPTSSRYNRATLGLRQLGSAFKPFVFAAAIQKGVPTSRVLIDLPLRLELSGNDVWEPSNYDGEYEGQVSLRQALVRSRNVPTVRLASEVGMEDVAATARAAGVVEPMDVTPSLALGTVAVSPLEIASAYTTFATLGYKSKPTFLLRVEDEFGTVLWEAEPQAPAPGMDPRVAYVLTDILRDAVDFGTGAGVRSAGYDGPVAGKTGTTNNATDAWFVGYTPKEVGAIWIGYDQPQPLGGSATGGGFAAPVWGRIMRRVYDDREMPDQWATPQGIVTRRIDTETGFVLQDGCHPRGGYESVEVFLEEFVPSSVCPYQNFWINMWDRIRGAVRLPVRANPLFDNPGKRPKP